MGLQGDEVFTLVSEQQFALFLIEKLSPLQCSWFLQIEQKVKKGLQLAFQLGAAVVLVLLRGTEGALAFRRLGGR